MSDCLAGKPSRPRRGVSLGTGAHPRVLQGGLTLEEVGDALADGRHAVAGAVGSDRADLGEEPLSALQHVRLVAELVQEDVLVLEEDGVLDEAEYLAEEGDGLLVELLGVADVCRDDLVKGQAGSALPEEGPVLLRLHGQLATHGVLGSADMGVDVVDVETSAAGRPHCADLVEGGGQAERWMAGREAEGRGQQLLRGVGRRGRG